MDSAPARTGRRGWIGALACATVVTGCAGAPTAEQGSLEPPPPFIRPHWDQVCFERGGQLPIQSLAEVADADWLARRLEKLAGGLPDSTLVVDVGANYSVDGRPRRLGLVESELELEEALDATAAVASALRPLGRLVEPLRFRITVRAGDPPQLELHKPLSCIPHAAHGDGPVGVYPGGVKMMGGRYYPGSRDVAMATLRIHVSESGRITEVEFLKGVEAMEHRARDFVSEHVVFQPALQNGEPIASSIVVSLIFPGDSAR